MPDSRDEWIEGLRDEVVRLREMLAPLESGEINLGERRGSEPWRDSTPAHIEHLRRTIAMLQSIVDWHDTEGT
jgi:hypothetical protein